VALVRVYCGISSAADVDYVGMQQTRLTAAIVDDSARLLEYSEINDDPAGYGALTGFLAERFGGSTIISVAVDSDDYLVTSLLAASGRQIAFTDDATAEDYAEHFADDESLEEVNVATAERRAVGLARALQAGALSANVSATPREFTALKPVLAAHAALAVGRQAAAVALREVLRELYPAALRAYSDPAAPVALAMLDALPEPGLLTAAAGRGRDAAVNVAHRLVSEGVCDNDTALEAVTALRVAITETPRRNGATKHLTAAVADAVRASVAAVRSTDAASQVLIDALTARVPVSAPMPAPTQRRRVHPTEPARGVHRDEELPGRRHRALPADLLRADLDERLRAALPRRAYLHGALAERRVLADPLVQRLHALHVHVVHSECHGVLRSVVMSRAALAPSGVRVRAVPR